MTSRSERRTGAWFRLPLRGRELGSYRRQAVVATAVVGTLAALLLIVVVELAFSESAIDAADRVLHDRADSVVRSAGTASTGTTLEVPGSELGPGVVVYDADGVAVAGEVPPALAEHVQRLAGVDALTTVQVGDSTELLARPFTTPGGADGVVVVAERLDPYQDQEWDALSLAILAGVVIVVATTGVAAWATHKALLPVGVMASTAEDWSEHDLGRRFDLGPPTNEIRALGQTLDGLLDRVSSAIVAEQRLTSELAHEIRSPLTAISGTAELISMRADLDEELREDVEEIRSLCRAMAEIVTGLLELARSQGGSYGSATTTVAEVVAAVIGQVDAAGRVRLDPAGTGDAVIGAPHDLAVRALAPVVANAARLAEHVTVTVGGDHRWVDLDVADDGPGIDPEVESHLFEPGWTGGAGSGLGLALARRVARSVGGEVSARPSGGAGAVFRVRLPRRSY